MSAFRYRGRTVKVSPTADIPSVFRPNGPLAGVVQSVLEEIEPWQRGDDPIETVYDLDTRFKAIVVPVVRGDRIIWGNHAGHKARHNKPSPFVDVRPPIINTFTVELVGTPAHPILVRGYPGEYIPPLPWQNSARDADGGLEACCKFWTTHAYAGLGAMRSPRDTVPPPWYNHTKPRHRR